MQCLVWCKGVGESKTFSATPQRLQTPYISSSEWEIYGFRHGSTYFWSEQIFYISTIQKGVHFNNIKRILNRGSFKFFPHSKEPTFIQTKPLERAALLCGSPFTLLVVGGRGRPRIVIIVHVKVTWKKVEKNGHHFGRGKVYLRLGMLKITGQKMKGMWNGRHWGRDRLWRLRRRRRTLTRPDWERGNSHKPWHEVRKSCTISTVSIILASRPVAEGLGSFVH